MNARVSKQIHKAIRDQFKHLSPSMKRKVGKTRLSKLVKRHYHKTGKVMDPYNMRVLIGRMV